MALYAYKAMNNQGRMVLGRLAELSSRLYEQSKKIDVKPLQAEIQSILDHGGEAAPAELQRDHGSVLDRVGMNDPAGPARHRRHR